MKQFYPDSHAVEMLDSFKEGEKGSLYLVSVAGGDYVTDNEEEAIILADIHNARAYKFIRHISVPFKPFKR